MSKAVEDAILRDGFIGEVGLTPTGAIEKGEFTIGVSE